MDRRRVERKSAGKVRERSPGTVNNSLRSTVYFSKFRRSRKPFFRKYILSIILRAFDISNDFNSYK